MEGPRGRHVQAALDEQRAGRVPRRADVSIGAESPVHVVVPEQRTTPDPDAVRRLYEQIGTLYGLAESVASEHNDDGAVQEVADFLDTVRRAVRSPGGQTAAALRLALHRYEHARNPRGDA